jgi:UDP-N-acetylglucosamine 4,6-dehydratase (inverting)
MLNNKTILITGGTGSFGNKFTEHILQNYKPKKIIIYSRDEYKQFIMRDKFISHDKIMRYFIGDMRDKERLTIATKNVDVVIHAAALKQVPAIEYNPFEAVKTNIMGAKNLIDAVIENKVKKIIALSTDKASMPINLYGGTKLISDKLFQHGNVYAENHDITMCVVRYGNVANSRGSVIPYFKKLVENGEKSLPITDKNMTRFYITLEQAVDLVIKALKDGKSGDILVPKIPSFRITDLVEALDSEYHITGIRAGEKIHESMINPYDSYVEYNEHYKICTENNMVYNDSKIYYDEKEVKTGLSYTSDNNEFLSIETLKELIK